MTALFLTRAALKRTPPIDALARQLLPNDNGARAHAAHRLVWSLFAGDSDRARDFLFRELAPGKLNSQGRTAFLVLSSTAPATDHPLLDVETKPFAPALAAGQILGFSLRANAVRQSGARRDGPHPRPAVRHDVVMHALQACPKEERGERRAATIQSAGRGWLEEQASRAGFRLVGDVDSEDDGPGVRIDGYEQLRFARLGRKGRLSVLEFDGFLEVTDPALLLQRIGQGFGRARAFGCGLMLIRRAAP